MGWRGGRSRNEGEGWLVGTVLGIEGGSDGNGGYARARTKREARVDVNNSVSPATAILSRDNQVITGLGGSKLGLRTLMCHTVAVPIR